MGGSCTGRSSPTRTAAALRSATAGGRIAASPNVGRSSEDLTLIGSKILLWFAPREIESPTHGGVQEQIPWAAR